MKLKISRHFVHCRNALLALSSDIQCGEWPNSFATIGANEKILLAISELDILFVTRGSTILWQLYRKTWQVVSNNNKIIYEQPLGTLKKHYQLLCLKNYELTWISWQNVLWKVICTTQKTNHAHNRRRWTTEFYNFTSNECSRLWLWRWWNAQSLQSYPIAQSLEIHPLNRSFTAHHFTGRHQKISHLL